MAVQPDLAEITKAGTIVYWVGLSQVLFCRKLYSQILISKRAICCCSAGHLWNYDWLSRWLRGPDLVAALPRQEARLHDSSGTPEVAAPGQLCKALGSGSLLSTYLFAGRSLCLGCILCYGRSRRFPERRETVESCPS